jgi:cell division transport system permease protein
MRSLAYFFREAFFGFRKNFSTVFGAVVTIFLSLLVIGIFLVATLSINQLVSTVENQVTISVYLNDNALNESGQLGGDASTLQDFIKSIPDVKSVEFFDKEKAMEDFKSWRPDMANTFGETNPLPASLEVTLNDPEQVQTVAEQIMNNESYLKVIDNPDNPNDSIRYGQQVIDKLFSISNGIRIASLILVVLLIFVALIFINNTIRLAIFARRKEIAIMRLVGASNGFIRGPFLMEGLLQALIGSALAILTVMISVNALSSYLEKNVSWLELNIPALNLQWTYLLLLLVGLVIGLLGSVWALRRYLKV